MTEKMQETGSTHLLSIIFLETIYLGCRHDFSLTIDFLAFGLVFSFVSLQGSKLRLTVLVANAT